MRPRLFGTLFYVNYLTRALALYRSLETHFNEPFVLLMVCMDESSKETLQKLSLPHAQVITVSDLEGADPALAQVKSTRSIAEYSWTCTPALMRYMLDRVAPGESVAYLDADLMFFSDPQPAFDEWSDADILIHEHRYSPKNRHMERESGVFNVGLVGMRNAEEAHRCLRRWHDQCIEICTVDAARGLCGDQKYLNEWPRLYSKLAILRHKGAGLAPWNIDQYTLHASARQVAVDDVPLIFYHFHAFRVFAEGFGRSLILPSLGYDFTPLQMELIYEPYVRALHSAYSDVRRAAPGASLTHNRIRRHELAAMSRWRIVRT
jgi:hypothetical protein